MGRREIPTIEDVRIALTRGDTLTPLEIFVMYHQPNDEIDRNVWVTDLMDVINEKREL